MKLRVFFILTILALPILLMGTINAYTAAMMPAGLATGTTTRVSVASDGTQGNDESRWPSISADGRYVAFVSDASNLVPGDTNGVRDVFVYDRQTGQTTRVSVASDGIQGNDGSGSPSISADGRYVVFASTADNLVPEDTNSVGDVFIHDRQTGQTSRVSVSSDGTQGNGVSYNPSISADGRYVAFASAANNLVPGDTNNMVDIFVHDRQTGQTSRVSVASDGTQGNIHSTGPISLSAGGRYVAFGSGANNLVPDDTNGSVDIFVHDRQTGQTSRVSVASGGAQGNSFSDFPSISADGRYVAFQSNASNLVPDDTNGWSDIFVHDRQTIMTSRVSVASDGTQGNYWSWQPSISADGRYVAFTSFADNLVPGDTNGYLDIFVHDLQTGQTSRVSVASGWTQGNGDSNRASISADGYHIAFHSEASNLVPDDTNDVQDIFVHEREVGTGIVIAPDQEATLVYTDTQGLTTTILIPVGGVMTETLLVYIPIDGVTPPSGLQFAGRAFELTAYQNGTVQPNFTFLQSVNVSLTYSDEQAAGLQEDALTLQVWDDTAWLDAAETCSPASTYVRDTANNVLSVDICHLSQFALMGPAHQPDYSIFLPLVVNQAQP
jgi:Tol biopolymer transport system component